MKIDGVRVIGGHRNCTGKLTKRGNYVADKRGGRTGDTHEWQHFVCAHMCGAEIRIREDRICEFAADLMRQAEAK